MKTEPGVTRVNTTTLRRLLEPLRESGRNRNVGLESTAIANVDYDPENQTLIVEFMQRGTFAYHDFPLDSYVDFAGAESWGKYFNLYIRDAGYAYERIA